MRIVLCVHSIVFDWNNVHAHFRRGRVAALAESPGQMRRHIQLLASSEQRRQDLIGHGRDTIRTRHNCDLRAQHLEQICDSPTARTGGV